MRKLAVRLVRAKGRTGFTVHRAGEWSTVPLPGTGKLVWEDPMNIYTNSVVNIIV